MTVSEIASGIISLIKKTKPFGGELGKFNKEFMDAVVLWIKPLFLKDDGSESEDYKAFTQGEDEDLNELIEAKIKFLLKKNPKAKEQFEEIITKVINHDEYQTTKSVKISGEKNVSNINSDNNSINIS